MISPHRLVFPTGGNVLHTPGQNLVHIRASINEITHKINLCICIHLFNFIKQSHHFFITTMHISDHIVHTGPPVLSLVQALVPTLATLVPALVHTIMNALICDMAPRC